MFSGLAYVCVCVVCAYVRFGGILEEGEFGEREKRRGVYFLGVRRVEEGI